jgi:hypothetical protein
MHKLNTLRNGARSSKRGVHYSILTKRLAVGPEDHSLLFEGQSDFETDCNLWKTQGIRSERSFSG